MKNGQWTVVQRTCLAEIFGIKRKYNLFYAGSTPYIDPEPALEVPESQCTEQALKIVNKQQGILETYTKVQTRENVHKGVAWKKNWKLSPE